MAKPKVPNAPSIPGAGGRHYMNPAYYGFPDPDNRAAQILERIVEIRERSRGFQREVASKRARIEQLRQEGHEATITAYVEGSDEFPSVNETAALQDDIKQLEDRVRAAKTATEHLAGQLAEVQALNQERWTEVLRQREGQLIDEYNKAQAKLHAVLALWKQHAQLTEAVTGERVFTDFAHPSKPIVTKDPDDVVISTRTAGSIT